MPYPGHDITIIDEDGEPVHSGDIDEIVLSLPDPVAFLSYWTDGSIREPPVSDRFHTGDLGWCDEDRYIFYEERADSVIISSDYRISIREIGATLEDHKNVREAAVGRINDDKYGNRVVAYAVLVEDSPVTPGKLKQRFRNRLRRYKVPREITVRRDLLQTHSGKINRKKFF